MQGIFRSELECILTDEQAKTYSNELARLTQTQAELEDRKKEITSDYKSRIDACISQTRVIARKVSTGKEMRDVEVRWEFDFPANVKFLTRLDTFEVIDSRPLTDNERQMCLDLEAAASEEEAEQTDMVSDEPESLPFMEESGEVSQEVFDSIAATEVIDPPDSFECKNCVTKKKAKKCGADCRQI